MEQLVAEQMQANNMSVDYLEQGFDAVVDMLDIFTAQWRKAWWAG